MYKDYTGPEIAKKFGVCKHTIYKILKRHKIPIRNNRDAQKIRLKHHKVKGHPRNNIRVPSKKYQKICEAYIIGALLGDGHLTDYMIRLKVTQKDFRDEFSNCIKKAYKFIPRIKEKNNIFLCRVHSVLLSKRLKRFTKNNSDIPFFVMNGNNEIKANFIKGFADAEGCVDLNYNKHQIVIVQKNIKILKKIQKLLLDLKIQSKIYRKKDKNDHLVISLYENLKRFKELIGFSIDYKREKLKTAVNYLEKFNIPVILYWNSLRVWISSNNSQNSSAKELGLNWGTFRSWVKGEKMPNKIKKDIELGWVPEDYDTLREHYQFLPEIG
jgi:hypothetical protein